MHQQHPHGFAPSPSETLGIANGVTGHGPKSLWQLPGGGGGGGVGWVGDAGTARVARVATGDKEGETEDMWNEFSVEASRGNDEHEPNLVCVCVCVILDPSHLPPLRPPHCPRLHIYASPTPAPPTHASRLPAALSVVLRGAERVHDVDILSHRS